MRKPSKRSEQARQKRTRVSEANVRIVATLLLCVTIILAGCAGGDGLGGSGHTGTMASSADGGSSSGSGGDPSDSGNGATTAEDSSASGGSGGTGAAESSNGGSSSSGSVDAEEDWFNLSKPGRYVFEIETAEEGTGRMTFETKNVANGQATVHSTYELGEDSFESTVTGPVGKVEPQLVSSPAYRFLIAIQLGGIGSTALSGGEDLQVGNQFSRQSSDGSLNIEVTKTDNYGGVDCYVIETRMNGTLNQKVCTQKAFSSVPYFATYDEDGKLVERVELVEYERE